MPFPSNRSNTLRDYLTQQSHKLSQKVASFTTEDLENSNASEFAIGLVDSVLPDKPLSIKPGRTISFPSKDVHYTKLSGQTNVGLNLRDVIEKTWEIEGSSALIEFMPSQVQEATRRKNVITAELIMGLGALEREDVLANRKAHLADITKSLEQAAGNVNNTVSEHRTAWIADVTKQVSERHQQLLSAAITKKQVNDFLNS